MPSFLLCVEGKMKLAFIYFTLNGDNLKKYFLLENREKYGIFLLVFTGHPESDLYLENETQIRVLTSNMTPVILGTCASSTFIFLSIK